jgi:hypothetical protein
VRRTPQAPTIIIYTRLNEPASRENFFFQTLEPLQIFFSSTFSLFFQCVRVSRSVAAGGMEGLEVESDGFEGYNFRFRAWWRK